MGSPFHIKSINIDRLFGGKDIQWSLDDNVNVISGKNGSGKSTILRLTYQLLREGDIIDTHLNALADGIIVEFTNGWNINWDKSREPHTIVLDEKGVEQSFDTLYEVVRAYYVNSFEMIAKEVVNMRKDGDNGITTLDLCIREEINKRNAIFTGALEKLFEEMSHNLTWQQVAERNPDIANFMDFYKRLHKFMSSYNVLIDNRIRFKTENEKTFDYTGLSSGEKQVLLLLLMVSNTKQAPCLFFMDEPDLALHIRWKQMLIKELKEVNPNMQLILSTHSPSVIEGWYEKVKEVTQITRQVTDV